MPMVPTEKASSSVSRLSSRFIAYLYPIDNEGEVASLIKETRLESPKADHYPYAYRCRGMSKSSDDGEPGGSSGKPMLTLLEDKDVDRCLIVVARYFGGSKLGIPRLRKSFLEAASLALDKCHLGEVVVLDEYRLSMDYHDYEETKKILEKEGVILGETDFGETVKASLICNEQTIERLKKARLDSLTVERIGKKETIRRENA